ncbi:cupin domain-containing protein [Erythrobacter insulae]|uniref:Cupin domain-containing protein n=1 Tax=Erythrobacter insulae TaxID=2584124 RepID=A0A547PCV1_9SPHN|nr:cupin domain-containing protein [Erythrobacter insulae]TRD11874.1 cupin domain-containing protein [Erythrobacter insulae]
MNDSADALIKQLQLQPHPEGGWYRETWRAGDDSTGRARGTAIIFLLKAGENSHWHRVDADELWLWQSGDPLELRLSMTDAGPVQTLTLGKGFDDGENLQGLIPSGGWQAARSRTPQHDAAGYTLVSCVVVPGFDFAGFELAAPQWEPGQ